MTMDLEMPQSNEETITTGNPIVALGDITAGSASGTTEQQQHLCIAALADIKCCGDQASSASGTTEHQQCLCIAALTDISSSCGDQASKAKGTTDQKQRLCIAALTDISSSRGDQASALRKQPNNNSIFA
jgi:hypothetical protein